MASLRDILYGVALRRVSGSTDLEVSGLNDDSRKIKAGDVFVAVQGTQVDGHLYIESAIENGATAIVLEKAIGEERKGITYLEVENSACALATMAGNFYNNPSRSLKLVGITGTNGKSSVATLLFHLFRKLGHKTGLFSTIEYRIDDEVIPATHTTPDGLTLNRVLQMMLNKGCEYCFMEVSSHALAQFRTQGLKFTGALFTNITHDHLDYHKTFDEYIRVKKSFFDSLDKDAFALVNLDDKRARVMLQNTNALKKTFALHSAADYRAKILETSFEGLLLDVDGEQFHSFLIGDFNAYNLLAAYAVASLLGKEKMDTLTALSASQPVNGRFDFVADRERKISGIVDYAHTPDALEKTLQAIHRIRTKNEQLITVVGCGGDRDKAKRPKMAAIACTYSDKVILTSDNPRTENPLEIINEMKKGVEAHQARKVLVLPDRREAIKAAGLMARKGDIILVAGKGHETYQEIDGVKTPFDDKKELIEVFETAAN